MNPNNPADMRAAILHGLRNAMAPMPPDRLARAIRINAANDVFVKALRGLQTEGAIVFINGRFLIPGTRFPITIGGTA